MPVNDDAAAYVQSLHVQVVHRSPVQRGWAHGDRRVHPHEGNGGGAGGLRQGRGCERLRLPWGDGQVAPTIAPGQTPSFAGTTLKGSRRGHSGGRLRRTGATIPKASCRTRAGRVRRRSSL